jgi:DNA-binding MarR family transcriptional regulator
LVESKLVEVLSSDSDARVRVVRITAAGRTRHVEAKRLWRHAQDDVNRTWGDARVASLHRQFDDLLETFHETTA